MNYNLFNILDCSVKIGEETFRFLGNVFNWILICIPVLLILLTTIDFAKDISSFDGKMKAKNNFVKRLIIGAIIFFLFVIIRLLIVMAVSEEAGECMDCLFSPHNCKLEKSKNNNSDDDNEDDPNKNGEEWVDSDTKNEPVEGCQVHFSGSDEFESAVIYHVEYMDILGMGNYSNFVDNIPYSYSTSLDALRIDEGTKLIIYEKENFEGEVIFEKEGPFTIYNRCRLPGGTCYHEYTYFTEAKSAISKDPEKNAWSTWDMHKVISWEDNIYETTGSFKILCKK